MRFLHLGASLYIPATRPDLVSLANLNKLPHLRSLIVCTEDAILPREVTTALNNLQHMLRGMEQISAMRFIRVRNPSLLRQVLQMDDIHNVTGFVFPKVTPDNVEEYFTALKPHDPFEVMLTLESKEAFDREDMIRLRDIISQERYRRRIQTLRIGGNDLLNAIGLRRTRRKTIYCTPLALVISQLVTVFRPHGFNLTAPVFEYLDDVKTLRREVRTDLSHGLFGKAAIHPQQIPIIEKCYQVSREELHSAEEILSHSAPAVFRMYDAMCEPATHRVWATMIRERAKIYGVRKK